MQYFIDPFGCAKNQVDAENMMASLNSAGWTAATPEDADLIIINSCGFIDSAKQESINAVLRWRELYPQKKILLAGCLPQRYKKELTEALPEADSLFGNSDLSGINNAAAQVVGLQPAEIPAAVTFPAEAGNRASVGNRPLLSFPGSAYVKISEGCDNRCSFCAIPLIRGSLKSREIPGILDECRALLGRGIRELCIIGQDIGSYGRDMAAVKNSLETGSALLPVLMEKLSCLEGDFWVRLLYIHPDHFPLPILDIMKKDSRFLPYFDLPFQHGSEKILALMNRRGNPETYLKLIQTIRNEIPDAVIRTTFLTGFPGETEEDFRALLDFQEKAEPDWAGCFEYSREEDTASYSMKPQVAKKIVHERKGMIENCQIPITERRMDRFIGRSFDVLVEEKVEGEDGLWLGRLPFQAPDVDGAAVINSDGGLKPGAFIKGRIFARAGFDLEVTDQIDGE